jgi:hypothetical protein
MYCKYQSSDKKIYGIVLLLFILFITTTTAFSQNENVKMRLDSVIWMPMKETFFYDSQGNEILKINYYWDDTSNYWMKHYKCEYMYDMNNNLIMMIEYDRRDAGWRADIKTEWTYNSNKNLTSVVLYFGGDTSNYWEEYYRHEYMYDSNNNLMMDVRDNENTFGRENKIENWYNSKGNKTKKIEYLEKNNARIEYYITEYFYDTNENLTKEISYLRKREDCALEDSYKTEYIYDIKGNIIKTISYNRKKNTWKIRNRDTIKYEYGINTKSSIRYFAWKKKPLEKLTKSIYTYNNDGKRTIFVEYSWYNNDWYIRVKNEKMYDANENEIMQVHSIRNFGDDDLELRGKTEYIYDLSYSIENLIIPRSYWLFFESNNMLMEKNEYSWEENNWKYHSGYKLFYSSKTTESNNEINKK